MKEKKERLNILVTGANGQLGTSIKNSASALKDNYIFTDIEDLDITDRESVIDFVEKNDIDLIVNCAAFTNVDKAEDEPEKALLLNASAVRNLADAIGRRKGCMIHVSTDYVFGGKLCNIPLTEDDEVCPTGVYGETKLAGEKELEKSGIDYLIFRTSWLYSEYGKNFMKTMEDLTSKKDVIKVVFDQCGTPTYAGDLAEAITNVIQNRLFYENRGIYHFSNEGVCSWFDFARKIAEIANNKNCKVLPCHSSEYPSKVKRPNYSVLDKTKIKETFSINIPYWTESLTKCMKNYGC